ncbi:MAG: hypothetical protein K1X29_08840 [Bdellovibrionales bacterium]|nr:hypothetical protein [Bdellovibrionales bacterium]
MENGFDSLCFIKKTFVVLILITLTSCLEKDLSSKLATIPLVKVSCSSSQHAGCTRQKNLSIAFVGLTSNKIDCKQSLTQFHDIPLNQKFDATGKALLVVDKQTLSGAVYTWVGDDNSTKTNLPAGTYQICSFVDLNNNLQYDANEPLGENKTEVGKEESSEVDKWS